MSVFVLGWWAGWWNALRPPELHIPDGFLSVAIALIGWLVMLGLLAVAVRRSQNTIGERQMPLLGIMAAFIFAAQMINFQVAGGTSGHLLGGALAAIALGPWAAMLVMTSVIGVQALLFQDGGLLALGTNILNMGMLTALIAYGLYRVVAQRSRTTRLVVAGGAAWLSVMGAALATSLQLWLSGTANLRLVIPAMLGVHALIGLGEALITVAALGFILRTRPDLIDATPARGGRGWIIGGVIAAVAVVVLAPLASADPDGLERVAQDMGFLARGQDAPYTVLPDYTIPGLGESGLSTIIAGLVGIVVVALLAYGAAYAVRRRRTA